MHTHQHVNWLYIDKCRCLLLSQLLKWRILHYSVAALVIVRFDLQYFDYHLMSLSLLSCMPLLKTNCTPGPFVTNNDAKRPHRALAGASLWCCLTRAFGSFVRCVDQHRSLRLIIINKRSGSTTAGRQTVKPDKYIMH